MLFFFHWIVFIILNFTWFYTFSFLSFSPHMCDSYARPFLSSAYISTELFLFDHTHFKKYFLPHQLYMWLWFLITCVSLGTPTYGKSETILVIIGRTVSDIHPHLYLGHLFPTEKAMAPHSSTLAWTIPWTEEPGGLQSMGSYRVGHD